MTDTPENKLSKLTDTADTTAQFDPKDIEQNKVMAVLSYLGILLLVPLLAAKGSRFARFHAGQGLNLLIALIGWTIMHNVLMAILRAILLHGATWRLYSLIGTILSLVYIVFTVLAIIGIINALNGKAKELPLVGRYKLLK
jgi:uncharacterized membrane protein